MKIYVRRRHIERGKPNKVHECPVALAYMDGTGKKAAVYSNLLFTDDNVFQLPCSAHRFIRNLDSGKPVKPFAFTIKA